MVKCTTLFVNREKILDLLKRTQQDFWDFKVIETTSPKKRECLQPLENLKKVFHVYIVLYLSALTSFVLFPIVSKGEELLIYECYRPPWLPYHVLLVLEQVVGTMCTLFTMLPVDFMFMSLITLTLVQYKLLNMELKQLFDTEAKTHHKESLERKIGECVKHHAYLYDYIKRINDTFSTSMLVFHVIVILSMCMEMYRVSSQSDLSVCLRPMLYTSFGLFQFIICYCAYSQALIDEANDVSLNIYLSGWQTSLCSAKSIMMIIAMAQKEVKIQAGGIANIDLKTGLDTLKTMISYCMFLRTMSHDSR
nr:unnamed protein product [Callosobruchus chinensis]